MTLLRKPLPPDTIQKALDSPCLKGCCCVVCCIHDQYGVRINPKEICWFAGDIFYDGMPLSQLYPKAFHASQKEHLD